MSELVYSDHHRTEVRLSSDGIDRLRSARVFFEPGTEAARPREGDVILFSPLGKPEPYTGFLGNHTVFSMGAFSYSWSGLPMGITVGRYCSLAGGIEIPGPRHPLEAVTTSSMTYDPTFNIARLALSDGGGDRLSSLPSLQKADPLIGHDVWIGAGASLMPGIVIGDGAVVSARSHVTRDVPPYAVVGGNPARVIRSRFPKEIIERLLEARWWRYSLSTLSRFDLTRPACFLDQLQAAEVAGNLDTFAPEPIDLQRVLFD